MKPWIPSLYLTIGMVTGVLSYRGCPAEPPTPIHLPASLCLDRCAANTDDDGRMPERVEWVVDGQGFGCECGGNP